MNIHLLDNLEAFVHEMHHENLDNEKRRQMAIDIYNIYNARMQVLFLNGISEEDAHQFGIMQEAGATQQEVDEFVQHANPDFPQQSIDLLEEIKEEYRQAMNYNG